MALSAVLNASQQVWPPGETTSGCFRNHTKKNTFGHRMKKELNMVTHARVHLPSLVLLFVVGEYSCVCNVLLPVNVTRLTSSGDIDVYIGKH